MSVDALPPLTSEQARAIAQLRHDPNARRLYEIFSGGFAWTDEFNKEFEKAGGVNVFRYLVGFRASLVRGEPNEGLRPTWESMVANYPEWPGLRPERRSSDLKQELEAEGTAALAEFVRDMDSFVQRQIDRLPKSRRQPT